MHNAEKKTVILLHDFGSGSVSISRRGEIGIFLIWCITRNACDVKRFPLNTSSQPFFLFYSVPIYDVPNFIYFVYSRFFYLLGTRL